MKSWSNRAVRWLRVVHRDLGYLMVGICLVYGISGMMLNHMNGRDPAYKSTYRAVELPAGLDDGALAEAWRGTEGLPVLKNTMPIDERHTRLMLDGGLGVYDSDTGTVDYELHRKRQLIYWVNKLHYNRINGWSIMADLFAVSLIFFALSGIFMLKGKNGLAGRGKWFLLAGLLIPVCYVLFS